MSTHAFVALVASAALAQDYTVTTAGTAQYLEARPSNASLLGVSSASGGTGAVIVTLPFEFPYYGRRVSTCAISAFGSLVMGASTVPNNPSNINAAHGQAAGGAFPYASSGDVDGLVAVLWCGFKKVNDGTADTGFVYTWTIGNAPNRRFVVSWDNPDINTGNGTRVTIQCHLYEATGRIIFSHGSGWPSIQAWICGLDSIVDSRFTVPAGMANDTGGNHAYSGADLVFDPRPVTFSGTLTYDRIVSDATGIGTSVASNSPLSGVRLELRRDGGIVAGVGTSAPDGTFSIPTFGVASSSTGTLQAATRGAACVVKVNDAASAREWQFGTGLSFASNANLGTNALTASVDSDATLRGAFHVASVCQRVHDWATARTSEAIPSLSVLLDPASTVPTNYNASPTPFIRIAGGAASDPDQWDAPVIASVYGRHVLAAITAAPGSVFTPGFDTVTDQPSAFAEAFGHLLWELVSGATQIVNGTGPSTATVYDLESPVITVTKGPNVTGCVAGALHDLVDAANELTDANDGTLTPDRPFSVAAALASAPTVAAFLQKWIDTGYDGVAITRTFVGDGVLPDDSLEPNDSGAEIAPLGNVGFRRDGLVLNRFNDDWFSITLPANAASIMADVVFDRTTLNTLVALEIRTDAGALLATGSAATPTSAFRAATAAVPAGTYRIGVRYVSGVSVPDYAVQAYVPLEMGRTTLPDWTRGELYDESFDVSGGIAPYTLSLTAGQIPPGLVYGTVPPHLFGTPTAPGSYDFTIRTTDAGNPANSRSHAYTVRINDTLAIALPAYVGFALGRPVDTTFPAIGGTPPIALTMPSGSLPAGLVLNPATFHVNGTPTSQSSTTFELDASDAAGASDHVAARAVVAVALPTPSAPAEMAAGDSACGWWFDAVAGTTAAFSVRTAKGRAKRVVDAEVLAPDRSVLAELTVKAKLGSLSVTKIVCPSSGRYYVIAASASGDATQLLGSVSAPLPKKGSVVVEDFGPSDTKAVEIGVVAGAAVTMKFNGDKKAALGVRVVGLTDPTGAPRSFAEFVTQNGLGGTFEATFAIPGTWRVVLGATPGSGSAGRVAASFKIKQPKGVVYSAE